MIARPRDWLLVPFLVAVAAVGIAWGGRATYRTIRNWEPAHMTCAEFLAHPSEADWVRLEGCAVGSGRIGIETSRRANQPEGAYETITAVYLPLRVVGEPRPRDGATLVLRSDHGPILRLGSRLPTEREEDDARAELARPIEGLVERSLDRSARDRDKLRDLGLNLAEDFIIIDYQARPRPLALGLAILGLGLGALALLVRKWRRRPRRPTLARATLVTLVLGACGGGASTVPAAPAPVAAMPPAAPTAAPTPAPPPAPVDDSCPPEWQPGRDDHALGGLTFERTYVKDTGDKRDSYIGKRACQQVVRCFEAIPKDQRSTTAVYEVVIEWPSSLYEKKDEGIVYPRRGFGAGGAGTGPYFPTIKNDAFTACVTAAIPEEHVSTLDDEKRVIRAIRYTVHAYTPPVGDRYFTGSFCRGGGRRP